jgi:hypothetical protein
MNKTGDMRKCSGQGKIWLVDLAAAQHLLSLFFGVKFLYGCVFCPRSYFVGDTIVHRKEKMCTVDIEKYRVPSSSCLFSGEDAVGGGRGGDVYR